MEKLGLTLTREGSDDDLKNLATALFLLHRNATEKWPGRRYTPHVSVSAGEVVVELTAWPAEMEALLTA